MTELNEATYDDDNGLRIIRSVTVDPRNCPYLIMVPEHWRDDGTCKCDDPEHQAMMIREWGYSDRDFAPPLAFNLIDDGTLDTVLECVECGERLRFNYGDIEFDTDEARLEFVVEEARDVHECALLPVPAIRLALGLLAAACEGPNDPPGDVLAAADYLRFALDRHDRQHPSDSSVDNSQQSVG